MRLIIRELGVGLVNFCTLSFCICKAGRKRKESFPGDCTCQGLCWEHYKHCPIHSLTALTEVVIMTPTLLTQKLLAFGKCPHSARSMRTLICIILLPSQYPILIFHLSQMKKLRLRVITRPRGHSVQERLIQIPKPARFPLPCVWPHAGV